jgi:YidC/Oxa1 family membrane protein insertase
MKANPRLFLWLALAMALWFNYEAWVRDYGPKADGEPAATSRDPDAANSAGQRDALDAAVPQASSGSAAPTSESPAQTPKAEGAGASVAPSTGIVRVRTDVLDVDIGLTGGELQRADLPKYPKVKGGSEPVRLFNRDSPASLYVLQSGLTGGNGADHPTHLATYTSQQSQFSLDGASELRVPLTWTNGGGLTVTKTFVFRRGEYRVDLEYEVRNSGGEPWEGAAYAQILRTDPPVEYSMFRVDSYAFRGPAIWDGEKYRKLDIEDRDDSKLAIQVTNGWAAALEHHFVSAIVPAADVAHRVTLAADDRKYLLSVAGPLRTVAPGESDTFTQRLFVGPKLQEQLADTGPELARVADYGRLWMLAWPLYWLLDKVYAVVGNWGWAIVIVTFLLKLGFYPLSEASGRSMAKMKTLAPRIKNLQENYKEDREKLGRAMMELYQREKINPVAGCLPIVVQIPVFLAFYWVLLESVEMRQAPFMGWINDLSSRDPWFILPAIMAAAMFIQYKLNPAPPDPVQAKVFMIMPLVMSVMFAFFPAGLVLYWVTNTVLSIAQQWNINRRIERAMKKG